jgi:hypothetical protein
MSSSCQAEYACWLRSPLTQPVLCACLLPCADPLLQAVTSHPGGLGSGWRMVILALRLGAADGSPAVMAQTQEALQVRNSAPYSAPGRVCSASSRGCGL